MMRPGNIVRKEKLLKRELKILEWKIKTRQISGQEAKEQGHTLLEEHYKEILTEVNHEAEQAGIGTEVNTDLEAYFKALDAEEEKRRGLPAQVDPQQDLINLLEKTKRKWIQIVDDLLAL